MIEDAELNAFRRSIRKSFAEFQNTERTLREQYSAGGGPAEGRDLLERTTRRFLLDDLLAALDWHADRPHEMVEEARAWSASGDRFYFDYLGLTQTTRDPALLFEAKAFDVAPPHRANRPPPSSLEMSALIAKALALIHKGRRPDIVAEWKDYLTDLRDYVASLKRVGATDLKRVAISAGGWLIVFADASNAFASDNPSAQLIHCFPTMTEMLQRADDIYRLLHRAQLVDSLPFVLSVQGALATLDPLEAVARSRGVLVATSQSGARLQPYPTRSVYPVVLWLTKHRWFAIVDPKVPPTEPMDETKLAPFVADLRVRGEALEGRLSHWAGDLLPVSDVASFAGLRAFRLPQPVRSGVTPLVGSTNWQRSSNSALVPLVVETGEGTHDDFVVATGLDWHYKKSPALADCRFHSWMAARDDGVEVSAGPLTKYTGTSFTLDGQLRHCAHGDHLGSRKPRCHIASIETNLCCHACALAAACWPRREERDRRPCPRLEEEVAAGEPTDQGHHLERRSRNG